MSRVLIALSATAVALPLAAVPASADPAVDGQFSVTGVGTNNQIAQGPDGNMWMTLDAGVTNDLARITPAGVVTEFNPAAVNDPTGITTGPDGKLWVTQAGGVATFDAADPNSAVATAIADITDARAITSGPDASLWTGSDTKLVKIPAANPAGATSFTVLTQARWITAGTDGNLWVADGIGGARVVRVTPGGVATPFATGGGPQGIAAGPNGQVAYSNPIANPQSVGRVTDPGPAVVLETPMADPIGVAFGTDLAYWFAQFGTNNLGRLTTGGSYSTLALDANTGPRQLSAGPNNTLWVTLDTVDKVAKITGVDPATPTPNPNPTPNPSLDTTITKKPKKLVRTSKPRAKVKVRFTGTQDATFQCRLNKRGWLPCTSPRTLKLRPGKYTFRVRAVLNGSADPTPAKAKFRVKRR
jgi:streptogramin lyase